MNHRKTEKRGEILLVEDDSSLKRAVSLKLSREGYDVHTASTLKAAWEISCAHNIALIICDIGLPERATDWISVKRCGLLPAHRTWK